MELSSSSQKSHSSCNVDRFVPRRKRWRTFASLCTVSSLPSVKVTCSSLLFHQGVSFVHHLQMSVGNDYCHILCLHMWMGSPSCQVTLVLCYWSEQWCWSRLFSPKGLLHCGTALLVSKLSLLFLHGNSMKKSDATSAAVWRSTTHCFQLEWVAFNTSDYRLFSFGRWQKKCL